VLLMAPSSIEFTQHEFYTLKRSLQATSGSSVARRHG
jgi:hypothetical protein